jgi:serine/threonine protein kinase, bacterial
MLITTLKNRYKILQQLGEGGFGKTFLTEDLDLPSGRRCVIKQLYPRTSDPQIYQVIKERFQREAAILEHLGDKHPQIPSLYAYFEDEDQFYLVQELIEGVNLTENQEQGLIMAIQ